MADYRHHSVAVQKIKLFAHKKLLHCHLLRSVVKLVSNVYYLLCDNLDNDTPNIVMCSEYYYYLLLKPLTKVTIVYVHFLVAGIR